MNYFEYFSEIEERFNRRRGTLLLLSTLDWALIETWREAGIPLAAVLRGIDNAFDKHDARSGRAKGQLRKINGLAWCAQAVLTASEELVEASTGLPARTAQTPAPNGFEQGRIVAFLQANAGRLRLAAGRLSDAGPAETVRATALRLDELATAFLGSAAPPLDELDRTLTALESRLALALRSACTETELVHLREAADRELSPYRGKMGAVQLRQVTEQLEHKKLLAEAGIPRLSLFYMGLAE